jgi:hypothetical protein
MILIADRNWARDRPFWTLSALRIYPPAASKLNSSRKYSNEGKCFISVLRASLRCSLDVVKQLVLVNSSPFRPQSQTQLVQILRNFS